MTPLETAIAAARDAQTCHATDQAALANGQAALVPLQTKTEASREKLNSAMDALAAAAGAAKVGG